MRPVGVGAESPSPTGKRRVHQHDGQPGGARAQHLVLGEVLRALVVPEEMLELDQRAPPRPSCPSCAMPIVPTVLVYTSRRHPALLHRADHVQGAADVDVVEELGIRGPEAVDRGQMEHGGHAVDGPVEHGRIADVALDPLDVEPVEVGVVAPGLDQRPHLDAVADERAHDRGADEPGRARDEHRSRTQDLHWAWEPPTR